MKHAWALAWLLVLAAQAADHPRRRHSNVAGRVVNGVTGETHKKAEIALRSQSNPSRAAATQGSRIRVERSASAISRRAGTQCTLSRVRMRAL